MDIRVLTMDRLDDAFHGVSRRSFHRPPPFLTKNRKMDLTGNHIVAYTPVSDCCELSSANRSANDERSNKCQI